MPYHRRRTFHRRALTRRPRRRFSKRTIYPPKRGSIRYRQQATAMRLLGPGKGPFPQALFTKFTYSDKFTLSSSTGIIATNVFNLNSLYDPDATGVGHQPRGYDALMGADNTGAPYNRYVVYGCKIFIRFVSGSNSSTTGSCGVVVHPATNVPPTNADEIRETSNSIVKCLNSLGSGSDTMKTVSWYVNIPGLRGMSKSTWLNEHDGAARYNTSPSYLDKATVFYQDDIGNSSSAIAHVSLTYYAKLSALNELTES